MDELELVVWIAGEGGETVRVFQSEFGAEELQLVKKLDGLGIG